MTKRELGNSPASASSCGGSCGASAAATFRSFARDDMNLRAAGIVITCGLTRISVLRLSPCKRLTWFDFPRKIWHGLALAGRAKRAQPGRFHAKFCAESQTM
eukprot:TRINITY_DN15106_c0_g1_i23.p2 TRINITY_DN15106_c0_g1~~TRINITY_DN15106_c0_g1_i23.p2  ORF type:complete len:102 (-),score=4.04 TRINITY_DN15106_c0_g1_i23:349-654(-)